jgi:transcriptional regulator with XRE-family HTH domain
MNPYSSKKLPSDYLGLVASNFVRARKQQKLTQQKMAEKSGVPLITIKRFEANGRISFESLLKLAHALDALHDFEQLFKTGGLSEDLEAYFS